MSPVGAVLCGGRSTRMGRDKATLELLGRPMGLWVADALSSAGLARVVALGGPGSLGLDVIEDPPEMAGSGPLAPLIAGLRAEGDIFVCPCDVPAISGEAIGLVLDAAEARPTPVVLAVSDQLEPLIGVYRAEALDLLVERRAAGARGPKTALRDDEITTVPIPAAVARNVNTPEDLAEVEATLVSGG